MKDASSSTVPDGPRVAVVAAVRTAIGRYLGALAPRTAVGLGADAIGAALVQAGVAGEDVDEVMMGQARQAGCGPNPARQAAIRGGVAETAPAQTINQACASGLQAVATAADAIRSGRSRIAVAGGMESMTNVPFLVEGLRFGYRLGDRALVDGMYRDGFLCPISDQLMGATAETLAREFDIPRAEQDEYAADTQRRCQEAREEGRFKAEIAPIRVSDRKGHETLFETDEHPRDDVTAEGLAKLPPVFDEENGTVHAGNSSGITDGAAALLLMSEDEAQTRDLTPLAFVGAAQVAGVDPARMGIGPVPAVRNLLAATGRAVDDFDLIELNEAFAAQVLACDRELELPRDRLNVNGGAIALGHPIGCTGSRITVTLLHEMARRESRLGLATLCVSGGMGMAVAFERN